MAKMRTATVSGWMRSGRRGAFGLWLSLLAVYVQILLPLIVVADLRIVEAGGSGFAALPICHVGVGSALGDEGTGGAPDGGAGHSTSCCPLCVALGAGAPYTAPAEIFIPARLSGTGIPTEAATVVVIRYDTALLYDARAPPLNG